LFNVGSAFQPMGFNGAPPPPILHTVSGPGFGGPHHDHRIAYDGLRVLGTGSGAEER